MNTTTRDTMMRIGIFNVRYVKVGERHGLNDCVTNDREPLVEFYDAEQSVEKFGPRGQFITRYDAMDVRRHRFGLRLDFDIPRWTATQAQMCLISDWLNALAKEEEKAKAASA